MQKQFIFYIIYDKYIYILSSCRRKKHLKLKYISFKSNVESTSNNNEDIVYVMVQYKSIILLEKIK